MKLLKILKKAKVGVSWEIWHSNRETGQWQIQTSRQGRGLVIQTLRPQFGLTILRQPCSQGSFLPALRSEKEREGLHRAGKRELWERG